MYLGTTRTLPFFSASLFQTFDLTHNKTLEPDDVPRPPRLLALFPQSLALSDATSAPQSWPTLRKPNSIPSPTESPPSAARKTQYLSSPPAKGPPRRCRPPQRHAPMALRVLRPVPSMLRLVGQAPLCLRAPLHRTHRRCLGAIPKHLSGPAIRRRRRQRRVRMAALPPHHCRHERRPLGPRCHSSLDEPRPSPAS